MLTDAFTTVLMLAWSLVFTIIWAAMVYLWGWNRPRRSPRPLPIRYGLSLPALLVAPLTLLGAYRLLGVNLLFPIHVLADADDLMWASIVPALVLTIISGQLLDIARQILADIQRWQPQTLVLLMQVTGQKPAMALWRLILVRAVISAWLRSLPWYFGELVVIEAVFNAPGLGLAAWHLARQRQTVDLSLVLLVLAGLYGLCFMAATILHRRLGRRLAGYE